MADGRVLIVGGADHTDRVHYASTEVYHPGDRNFRPGPAMAQRRYKIAATGLVLANGDVLIPSGARTAELLEVRRWKFRELPDRFPAAYRYAATALLANGDAVIAGGYSDTNENTAGVWRFHKARD
jgi:hypothetical protein